MLPFLPWLYLYLALLWRFRTALAVPQTILSVDGLTTYTCPEQETAEVAYYDYCPSQNTANVPLLGRKVTVNYRNAAQSSFVTTTNGDIVLTCLYGTLQISPLPPLISSTCVYNAGGGAGMTRVSGTNCPTVQAAAAQPSPGVNYKRNELKKRAPTTQFNCPWTNASPDKTYLSNSVLYGGYYATSGNSQSFDCNIFVTSVASPSIVTCSWGSNGALAPTAGSTAQQKKCPVRMCGALFTGTGNFRRSASKYGSEAADLLIARNQINTTALRVQYARNGGKKKKKKPKHGGGRKYTVGLPISDEILKSYQ